MNKHDRKIVENAKVHGGTMGTKGRDLLEIIDRLDKQNQEMQALLERVVEIDKVFDDDDPDKPMAWHKLCLDVKTLMKEAKEVKDARDE